MLITATINNKKVTIEIKPGEYLVDTLRKMGNYSVRRGCDTSCCGLCSVLIDDKPVLSCSMLSIRADGKKITTIEGLQDEVSKFAAFLTGEGADQCGFCSPGFILSVIAMKKELKNPNDEDIKHYLAGNLCRCTGYVGQLRAIKKYLKCEEVNQ